MLGSGVARLRNASAAAAFALLRGCSSSGQTIELFRVRPKGEQTVAVHKRTHRHRPALRARKRVMQFRIRFGLLLLHAIDPNARQTVNGSSVPCSSDAIQCGRDRCVVDVPPVPECEQIGVM